MKIYLAVVLFLSGLSFSYAILSAEKNSENNEETQALEQKTQEESNIQQAVLGMNVSGNKELPNVLYIVPWKAGVEFTQSDNFSGKNSKLLQDIYAPIEPEVYRKQIKFYQQIIARSEKDDN